MTFQFRCWALQRHCDKLFMHFKYLTNIYDRYTFNTCCIFNIVICYAYFMMLPMGKCNNESTEINTCEIHLIFCKHKAVTTELNRIYILFVRRFICIINNNNNKYVHICPSSSKKKKFLSRKRWLQLSFLLAWLQQDNKSKISWYPFCRFGYWTFKTVEN